MRKEKNMLFPVTISPGFLLYSKSNSNFRRNSMDHYLPSTHEALGSITSIAKHNKTINKNITSTT